ncbi:MAG: threonine ammonia-lyase [Candidatus Bipolaricaulota bacterium]
MTDDQQIDISLEKIREASRRIGGSLLKTPCLYSQPLSRRTEGQIYLKMENLQVTQAFKARGNANKIALLKEKGDVNGVITASSGNHGLGLSLAARAHGLEAKVVVPEVAPSTKIEKIRENGAEVIVEGDAYDDASILAHQLAQKLDFTYVHSFDDPDIIAGNGSMGLEILEDVPEVDTIVVPIGGGGGISGISLAAKRINDDITVVGVEAENAPAMYSSVQSGSLSELPNADTFADGIAVREPGKLTFEIVRRYVDEIVTVSEEEMKESIYLLAKEAKIVAEAAGAASTAAILFGKVDLDGGKTVGMVSGGNIDIGPFREILRKYDPEGT